MCASASNAHKSDFRRQTRARDRGDDGDDDGGGDDDDDDGDGGRAVLSEADTCTIDHRTARGSTSSPLARHHQYTTFHNTIVYVIASGHVMAQKVKFHFNLQ